jgi:leader peptidase (prepilin peptidase)/N-methyltransferase
MARYFDSHAWQSMPFHFWSIVFFIFGAMVGSFLNVCIYRMPRGMSVVSPPSHCPHCNYSIPWFLNIPLFTWLFLKGRCAHCRAPISTRYFLVELLTGLLFLGAWLTSGRTSPGTAAIYCVLLAGLIAATFIDFEHFIIPDEITFGGMAVGFVLSFLVPSLHRAPNAFMSLKESGTGIVVGAGMVYAVLRIGKLLFGKKRRELPEHSRILFTETAIVLPGEEIPFEELFYRKSDSITVEARTVEIIDRCYKEVRVRLSPERLEIGEEVLNPENVLHMEVFADRVVLPQEAMGLGDVKFMGAIGAFLGWKATVFSLMASSVIGAVVGIALILLKRQAWSSKLPYGPYIALAAIMWMFGGDRFVEWWFAGNWARH